MRTSCRARRRQAQVGAAEGDDARVRVGAGGDREAVGPGPGAADRVARLGDAAGMGDPQRAARAGPARATSQPVCDRPRRREQVLGVRAGDRAEVDDPGGRRVQGGDPGRVRLDLADAVRRRGGAGPARRSPSPVARAPRARRARPRSRRRSACRSARRGCRALRSTRTGRPRPRTQSSRLQRARRVVDAGVDRPPSCGRSGGCRSRPPSPARRRCGRGRGRSARGRRRGRECRRPPPRCHVPPPRTDGYATSVPALEIVIVSSTGRPRARCATCLRTLRENPYGRRDARPRGRQRQHRRHPGDGPRRVPRGAAARARLERRLLHRQQRRPAELRGALRPGAQPRHRDLPRLARPHDGPDGERPLDRHVELPARAARRHPRPRLETLLPHPARLARPLRRGRRPARPRLGQYSAPELGELRARRGRRGQRRLHADPQDRDGRGRPARRGLLALHGRPRLVLPLQAGGLAGRLRRPRLQPPRQGRHDEEEEAATAAGATISPSIARWGASTASSTPGGTRSSTP